MIIMILVIIPTTRIPGKQYQFTIVSRPGKKCAEFKEIGLQ